MANSFDYKRQLQGTAFLSLEHWSYMILVVVVPAFLLAGLDAALAIWTNRSSDLTSLMMVQPLFTQTTPDVSVAISTAATLMVLAPLLYFLHRRTQAELLKRPGYQDRLAYKLPVYGALLVLAALKTTAFIVAIAAVLQSLTLIGVRGADVGALYTGQFLPALLAMAVFGATSWYVIKLAKGQDHSGRFAFMIGWLAALLVVALFTTAVMTTHNQNTQQQSKPPYSVPRPDWLE